MDDYHKLGDGWGRRERKESSRAKKVRTRDATREPVDCHNCGQPVDPLEPSGICRPCQVLQIFADEAAAKYGPWDPDAILDFDDEF